MNQATFRAVPRRRASAGWAALLASMLVAAASAQTPQQVPPMAQPVPLTPPPMPAQAGLIDPSNPNGASPRFVFAAALALVAKSVATNVASSLGQSIVNWFSSSAAPTGGGPAVTPWVAPPAASAASAGAYPQAAPGAIMPPAFPNPIPGSPQMSAPMAAAAPGLYAGIAFEVHVLGSDGSETTVDPATYVFRSGERFVVYYRPSLPGRVRVFNVNPSSEVIPIETLTLAAGQLAKLGPYLLTDPAGDEALRLVLEPCSSPELVAATRNIVKAEDTAPAVGNGVAIPSCPAAASTPVPGTRNIVKATMDGGTGFALDAVSSQELASGRLAARETTIGIHHR